MLLCDCVLVLLQLFTSFCGFVDSLSFKLVNLLARVYLCVICCVGLWFSSCCDLCGSSFVDCIDLMVLHC